MDGTQRRAQVVLGLLVAALGMLRCTALEPPATAAPQSSTEYQARHSAEGTQAPARLLPFRRRHLAIAASATSDAAAAERGFQVHTGDDGGDSTAVEMLLVLRDRSVLRQLIGLCLGRPRQLHLATTGSNATDASNEQCALLRGTCRRIFRTALWGVAGAFSVQQLRVLRACLPSRALVYTEPDARVYKAEHGSHGQWWLAKPPASVQPPMNGTSAVQAFDGSEGEVAGEGDVTEATHRWELLQVAMEADQQLTSGQPLATSFSAGVDRTSVPVGASGSPAELLTSAAQVDAAMASPGRKVQRLPAALWSLDRISQRSLPLDGDYGYGSAGSPGTGRGVTIYTVDSGIKLDHQEFQPWGAASGAGRERARASYGFDFVEDDSEAQDCDGHGTHVASTAIGRAVGVAKDTKVVAVRVLDCKGSGSISNVVAALDWVAANAQRPAVVTLSLGVAAGDWSRSMEDAVRRLVRDHNITVVVAAGNDAVDCTGISPARVHEAIAVGATNLPSKFGDQAGSAEAATPEETDTLYSYSNTGQCIDLFAPGSDIYAACGGPSRCKELSPSAYTWASGTSMAVPIVAGAAALYLADHPAAPPAEVRDALVRSATRGRITSSLFHSGTPNVLLYVGPPTGDELEHAPQKSLLPADGDGAPLVKQSSTELQVGQGSGSLSTVNIAEVPEPSTRSSTELASVTG